MDFELQPVTDAGRELVDLADKHAADFATRADDHDRAPSFAFENYRALQESGLLGAAIPAELGGMGVESLHDIAVAFNRLGRGDAATSLGAYMHAIAGWTMSSWRTLRGDGDPLSGMLDLFMAQMVRDQLVCAALSEPGSNYGYPLTEVTPTDGGWLINGRKIFCTNSPAATMVMATVRFRDPEAGADQLGFAWVPRDATGLEICDNWDALGMRGSGSNDIVFRDCFVPGPMAMPLCPWGHPDELMLRLSIPGLPGLVAIFLGVAEAAHEHVVELLRTRRKAPNNRTMAERPSAQWMVAENEIDLAACRAMLSRTCLGIDAALADPTGFPLDAIHGLHKDIQCTKTFVQRKAVEIVDRTLTLSGGSGYLASSPLSRHYRDVRAGSFMQPYSPNEAFEYIGKVALGLDPAIDV
jgi:alkylation response protein AidB-like acyl-CoA dehydrogenase